MPTLPPLLRDQRKIDASNIRLLAIFHFVLAGFAVLGLGLLGMHYAVMHALLENPEMFGTPQGGTPPPNPEVFFAVLRWFYVVAGFAIVTGGIVNAISGVCLLRHKARIFSMIVAGFDCMGVPFGTVLGVFTLIVLARESVRELYEADPDSAPPPLITA